MALNRKAFYDALRPKLGALTQANVVGFEHVLDEAQGRRTPIHDLAYILATAWWESGKTMQPVREAYWLSEAWRKKNLRYYPFYGRGLVQITWLENYQKASNLYGVDLVSNPDKAMDPKLSVRILFDGMKDGWFTGKALDDYIDGIDETDDEDLREYINGRRIVNGTDKDSEIGNLALTLEGALQAAQYNPERQPDDPDVEVPSGPKPRSPIKSGGLIAILVGAAILVAFFIFGR
eukprot:jgi/Tetstr1/441068/TSEL_029336.t1